MLWMDNVTNVVAVSQLSILVDDLRAVELN